MSWLGACVVALSQGCAPVTGDMNKPGNPPQADLLASAVFSATHNSYSGGPRGTILQQLEAGVRFIEFDIHDEEFAREGYRIGHDDPGHEVAVGGGNPTTTSLQPWLELIRTWSADHPDHAPITVLLDLKGDLSDNPDYGEGNLVRLDEVVDLALGPQRVLPGAVDADSTLDSLRGGILAVLSGDERTRSYYLRDTGRNPAIAGNGSGVLFEMHDSGEENLWYWSGAIRDGAVTWLHHGRVDLGSDPAVALASDGTVVEVHVGEGGYNLWYRTGQLNLKGQLTWTIPPRQFPDSDDGARPSLQIIGDNPLRLREIHQSPSSTERWYWDGTLQADGTIEWTRDGSGRTSAARFPESSTQTPEGEVSVWSEDSDPRGQNVLKYRSAAIDGEGAYLIYPQRLFVEEQRGDPDELRSHDAKYVGSKWSNTGAVSDWLDYHLGRGHLVRFWGADDQPSTFPPISFRATDTPQSDVYREYLERSDWVY